MEKRKGRKWKIVVFALLLIAAFAAIAVFTFLNAGKNSVGAREYAEKISAATDAVTEKRLSEVDQATQQVLAELGVESPEIPKDDKSQGNSGATASGAEVGSQSGDGQPDPEQQKIAEQKKQALVNALKEKYYGILNVQKQDAMGMVNNLLEQAKRDYKALSASGGKTPIALGNLLTEYMAKSNTMEANMDKSFEATVGKMEEQFSALGIDGTTVVTEFRSEYKSVKESNRKYFMDKAWDAIK